MISRRRFLGISAAGVGLGAGVGLYTWRVEPHWLEVVERRLPIPGLPKDLEGWRLAQLSDLHIGPRVDDAYLARSLRRVERISPELVVYTGDFTTWEARVFDHARRMFSHLPLGRRGTFGILGNHDYGPGWSQPHVAQRIAALATDAGVRILRNQVAEVAGLHVVGLDDLWADRFNPAAGLRELPAGAAAVVLSHNPDTVDLPGWGAYSGWILAGHTHGGQCKPPFLPPPLLPVNNRRYTAGEFALAGGRRLYISRGIGHLLTVRFNVRPEITVFHLEHAAPARPSLVDQSARRARSPVERPNSGPRA
jgi:predicted MPP superfamily phosphohydrolase